MSDATTVPIPPGAEVIGVAGIAELLNVEPRRVSVWRTRGLLPEPRWQLAARIPAWDRADVEAWAREHGYAIRS